MSDIQDSNSGQHSRVRLDTDHSELDEEITGNPPNTEVYAVHGKQRKSRKQSDNKCQVS